MSEKLEAGLQRRFRANLEKIYERYGKDPDNWGWLLRAKYKCRVPRSEGFKSMELNADLKLGRKLCPFANEYTPFTKVPHPACNVAGAIFAEKNSGHCPLCGLKPAESDFEIE